MEKVNIQAVNHAITQATEKAVKEITSQVNKGLSNFRIQYWAPSYEAGTEILRIVELEGVKRCNLGVGSFAQSNGSYRFDIKLQSA